MSTSWVYTSIVMLLFAVLVIGVPLFPEFMATPLSGPLNLGMLSFLALQIVGPLLAFIYLKQRQEKP